VVIVLPSPSSRLLARGFPQSSRSRAAWEKKGPRIFHVHPAKKIARRLPEITMTPSNHRSHPAAHGRRPNQPAQSNAGSRPFSVVLPASASPSLLGPRG
jgi:hypothetical protein